MYDNPRAPSSGNNTKSRILLILASIAVLLSFPSFSAEAELYFPLLVCAAATAFIIDILKSPLFALAASAASFGIAYLISKDVTFAIQCAVVPLIVGALFVLCRRKSLGLFKSSIILGAAAFALSAAFAAFYIVKTYGDLIAGAKTLFSGMYENMTAQMKNYLSSGNAAVTIAENELREMISLIATLLPGIAAALLQITGAATYILSKLYYRIFGNRLSRITGEYKVPESAIIFFTFSLILSLILSLIKDLRVAHLAAVNLCIALFVPTLIDGGRRVASKFRNPPKAILPDGREVKRPPIFLIALLAISLFFSFIAPFAILAIYSIAGTVKDIVARSVKKKEE